MKCKLSDICSFRKGKVEVENLNAKNYISTENMLPNKCGITEASSLPTVSLTQEYNSGDVLVSNIRPYFKKIWQAEYDGGCSNDVLVFVPKPNTDKDFLYYVLADDDFFTYSMATSKGTKMPRGDKTSIMQYEVPLIDLQVQKKIASVLKALDERIKLNNEINNNLAEQSQAIFAEFMCKYPYVLSPLGDMAEIIDCLHSKKPKAVNGTTYQLLQLNNITDSGFLDLSSKYYISKSDYENWTRKCEIVEGDCVITNVGRIGAVSQAPNGTHAAMGRNMTCIRLRNDKPFYSYLITALLSPHIRREIMKNTDEGTIMGALNVKNIPLLLFPMFALPTMNALEDLLSPIRKAIEQNYLSNQMLSLLRDSLLPRLMSGELDVSNIEI
ncbi:restriction endonuclease subunit S [Enterocloster bolteae]|uniref:restriction endonuclease subunit S n=1 Tax=Enterocloster bolteae TaxID=208479 RepID=UPI0040693458